MTRADLASGPSAWHGRVVVGAALLVVVLMGCAPAAAPRRSALSTPSVFADRSSTVESIEPHSAQPTSAAGRPSPIEDAGYARCSHAIDDSSTVRVASGELTVAAAYAVTGQQMTRYFISELGHSDMSNGTDWWNNPEKLVDMCVLDGDFQTQTPGPPGHDTRATRVLVVIDDHEAFAWTFCFSSHVFCGIPTTDPATLSARLVRKA